MTAPEPDWTGALCREANPELFFPPQGVPPTAARSICGRCPLRVKCLDYAIARREEFGVWGGVAAKERITMWRKQDRAQARTTEQASC